MCVKKDETLGTASAVARAQPIGRSKWKDRSYRFGFGEFAPFTSMKSRSKRRPSIEATVSSSSEYFIDRSVTSLNF